MATGKNKRALGALSEQILKRSELRRAPEIHLEIGTESNILSVSCLPFTQGICSTGHMFSRSGLLSETCEHFDMMKSSFTDGLPGSQRGVTMHTFPSRGQSTTKQN